MVFGGYLVDEGLETSEGMFVDDALPLEASREVALLLIVRGDDGADDVVTREYVMEKIRRVFNCSQWWHCIQMLHPLLHPAFVEQVRTRAKLQ